MFSLIFLVLLIGAGVVLLNGLRKRSTSQIALGAFLLVFVWAFFQFMDFWSEKLWFDNLGYINRFWILELSRYGFALAGIIVGVIFTWLILLGIPRGKRWIRYGAMAIGGAYALMWGYVQWPVLLLFMNQVPTELTEPIFGQPTSFYFFGLPFYNAVLSLFLVLTVISIIAAVLAVFVEPDMWRQFRWNQYAFSGYMDPAYYKPVFTTLGLFLLFLAAFQYFSRYEMLLSSSGIVYGPGWTDVNVRLPMIWVVIVLTSLAGIIFLIPGLRRALMSAMERKFRFIGGSPGSFIITMGVVLATFWFLALGVIPGVVQNYRVRPNEITMERPFIINNIHYTREAFKLNNIEEREYPAAEQFTRETVENNRGVFANIRLWDYRALDAVYKQFQEFRLYYEFEDIDVDRYRYNNEYNQVMVAVREMDVNNLPQQSQTFINRKFKYTHGFGIVMNDVSEFTPGGLPQLLIKNIPPVSQFPELAVEEPRIYYGEYADEYVIVNSTEEEFDFPTGDDNAYYHYQGKGGVQLTNYWRQFLYAYKFNESKLLFSGYPHSESRIMFHRSISNRIQRVAPFLQYDDDPYIVLADGRLYWIIDAYTTSRNFPYSQPFTEIDDIIIQRQQNYRLHNRIGPDMRGVNYMRNSVKVVVDAYNGDVDYYIFEEEDPLIQAWNNIVPGLLKPWQEMPKKLLEHIRYPEDILLVQGIMYAKYHMTDPTVFYNQEDLWVRATEKYFDQVQPVEPYYIMWELPENDEHTFVIMMPFTPKNRQVLVGWLAGMCDPEHYGRLLAYSFPKDRRILGPQQVETKIDQDPNLSSQLALWDQRGSRVIRGNVLAIPVNGTLFYVEPIYLQAETAAYPELRLVVLMHEDHMAYAPTFEGALQNLLRMTDGERVDVERPVVADERRPDAVPAAPTQVAPELNERIRAANKAFEDYIRHTGARNYQQASEALQRLEENLRAMRLEQEQ